MSYYDFYRPESYRPTADVYLKKTSAVNDDIDTLRHATTQSLLSRRDVVVVASVSCLYGLGVPDEYRNAVTTLRVGEAYNLADLEATLASLRYEAGGARRGTYAVQYLADGGAELTLMPVGDKRPVRLDFGPHDAALDVASDTAFHGTGTVSRAERRELRGVWRMPPPRGAEPPAAGEDGDDAAALAVLAEAEEAEEEAMAPEALEDFALFPASHHITSASERERVVRAVMSELKVRAAELRADGRVEIAERLEQRTRDDMRDFAKAGYDGTRLGHTAHDDGPASHPTSHPTSTPLQVLLGPRELLAAPGGAEAGAAAAHPTRLLPPGPVEPLGGREPRFSAAGALPPHIPPRHPRCIPCLRRLTPKRAPLCGAAQGDARR